MFGVSRDDVAQGVQGDARLAFCGHLLSALEVPLAGHVQERISLIHDYRPSPGGR